MNALNYTRIDQTLPRIAIVGRPNVGKSTLFNRLIRSRRAITDPTPGVTRDPLEEETVFNGVAIVLVDTGGYSVETGDFDELVMERCIDEMKKAHIVLCVVDVVEVTPEDEELFKVVRAHARQTILVVNKVDNEQREMDVWNFYALGFDTVVHVSAEHKRNFEELTRLISTEIVKNTGDARARKPKPKADIRLTLLGKPNTGKSTLLNLLLNEERSIVSPIPGTTRDVINGEFEYKSQRYSILDTAGIRRKRSVHESIEYYSVNRALRSIEMSDVVLLIIDATEGLVEQDKKIATQVIQHGKAVVLILNKWDLVDNIENSENAIRDRSRFVFPVLSFAPLIPISAKTGEGVTKVLDTANRLWNELQTTITTGQLNRSLADWVNQHSVPHGGGARFAVRYMTQISSAPLRFVLFVNRKRRFPESWISYLTNRMREEFNMAHVPIDIEVRES